MNRYYECTSCGEPGLSWFQSLKHCDPAAFDEADDDIQLSTN